MPPASPNDPSAHRKLWEEKNPWIAGVLAYLVPGAGHFYQGRMLKGVIYSVSILGLFLWGQKIGEGMVVYNLPDQRSGFPLNRVALSYAAQLGVGVGSLPSLLQNKRADQPSNKRVTRLSSPLSAEFTGVLAPSTQPDGGRLTGKIRLDSTEGEYGPEVRGTFTGQLDGQPVELSLGGRFEMDKPIKAGFRRKLEVAAIDTESKSDTTPRVIVGTIPRSILDAYGSPPDPEQLQDLNGRLGKLYELALVFTWIAGLLNVLAIWDCVNGPAYGFGDEHLEAKKDESSAAAPSKPELPRGNPPPSEPPPAESHSTPKAPV